MIKFSVEGMRCKNCVDKIGKALVDAGFKDPKVSLDPPEITLYSEFTVEDNEIQRVVSSVGEYKITRVNSNISTHKDLTDESKGENLTPLFVVLTYIIGGVLLRAYLSDDYSTGSIMNNFMGAFLVVFSLFKLLNLSGFADAYATYDIIASRSRGYALLYPFIELGLGIAYLIEFMPIWVNSITALIMLVGSVGVYSALKSKKKFQCACLGTALKLPMTKVTLIEDLVMGIMALIMIYHLKGA